MKVRVDDLRGVGSIGRNVRLTMRMRFRLTIGLILGALAPATGWGQTHAVKKSETVVRAVAVYEWTGDAGKPTASRVVPVSLFINGQFEDAGVYMARPVPFVLDSGNIFELEKSGAARGMVELAYQRHLQPGGVATYEDGWTGYGRFKPVAQPVIVAAKKSGPLPQVVASGGNEPHFSNKGAADADKNKPVDRSGAAGNGTTVSATPADTNAKTPDPDEPTLHKKAETTASTGTDTSDPDDPAERPTLKRRTPQEQKAEAKKKATASVTGSGDLNDDPDRPNLHRGKAATAEEEIPALNGVPANMQQMVGVSDARNRQEHDFARVWESDDEKAEVTAKLEAMARAKLAAYGDVAVAAVTAAAPAAAKAKTTAPQTAAARARAKKAVAAAAAPLPAPQVALSDEAVKSYTLSYGGAATFVLTASSPGAGKTTRYVAVVAQRDPTGALQMATSSATDSDHLDRAPWMRLVDAVDADASNRASLLFELRAQSSRQFALYRVIGAKAEQIFATENAN